MAHRHELVLILAASVFAAMAVAQEDIQHPGRARGGTTLLPNGWRIDPAGRHLAAGDLPLAMALHPEGRYLAITNNGWSKPSLRIVDLVQRQTVYALEVENAWLGLVWHPDGDRLFSSGAADNTIMELAWEDRKLEKARTLRLQPPQRNLDWVHMVGPGFVGGLALSPDAKTIYAAQVYGSSLAAVDLESGRVVAWAELPAEGYDVVAAPDGEVVYASVWGGAKVGVFNARLLKPLGEIAVGEHPNAMVLSPDGRRLFVACANTNAVWVIDTKTRRAVEQVRVSLAADDPPGSTPNALAISPDGATLLVANADNNTVAVVDVRDPREATVAGFIPTGWYPTGVAIAKSGQEILVLSGKGLSPAANPRGPDPVSPPDSGQYIAGLLSGAVSRLSLPQANDLEQMSRRVLELRAASLPPPPASTDAPTAIPHKVGDPSPIMHVFYVIRENRTYDQVFGDLPRGNGDPDLTLFDEKITPNAHALASQFVLFDNFYVDAEVSYDGHSFSTAAYATDSTEKLWPALYGGRGGLYLSEGGFTQRNPYGNLAAPANGYLWDFAARAGIGVRSYGEFAHRDDEGKVVASVPGLEGKVHPRYPPWDLDVTDVTRAAIWLEEFENFEKTGDLPRLSIIRLGNDHTSGTVPGKRTPRAMVADNDLALGRIVEAISSSRFWGESAIFVLEDDAQNGPDHVDAHRSVLLVASPYALRGALDSTLYTTSGVLRTIELILGLPPMSQYDASARPLWAAFTTTADLRPYHALPARVPLDEVNGEDAPGAAESLAMVLEEADVAPERGLNEIVWKAMRGADSEMPPPVRSALVRPLPDDDDDE